MNVAIKKEFQGLIQRIIEDESDGKYFKVTPSMIVHRALEQMFDKSKKQIKASKIPAVVHIKTEKKYDEDGFIVDENGDRTFEEGEEDNIV